MDHAGPIFGSPAPDRVYQPRPCVYGVCRDAAGRVLASRSADGAYFLPGGGIEPGEDAPTALVREVAEELGRVAHVGARFATASEYVAGAGEAFHKLATFYVLEVGDSLPGALPEHAEAWLPFEAAVATLDHQSHRWAVACTERSDG